MYLLPLLFAIASSQKVLPDVASHPNWALLDRGEDCGLSASDRIIGGRDARLGQYPWIVQLGYAFDPDPSNIVVDYYNCGGSIINDRYILSAAHCDPRTDPGWKTGNLPDLVQVRLGEHDINSNPDCQDGVCALPVQDINIEKVITNKGYDHEQKQNDISLIRLVKPISFNRYVYPICLPVYEKMPAMAFGKTHLEVAGWGVTDLKTKKRSSVLQTITIPFIRLHICRMAYSNTAVLKEGQMCAGGVAGVDSCEADSGGPLMTALSVEGPPRYFLMGVVSFGLESCAVRPHPAVYTKVSAYLGWILDNIRK